MTVYRPLSAATAFALIWLCCTAPALGEGVGLYLWKLDNQPLEEGIRLTEAPVTVALGAQDGKVTANLLEEHTTVDVLDVRSDSILVLVRDSDSTRRDPTPADTDASFVIDFDQPSVAAVIEQVEQRFGGTPTPEELRQFAFAYITDKSYGRAYDIASRVAEKRAGDCTEHAFLLTALARASGYRARVVVGVLMVGSNSELQSLGHAWSEIHDGQAWRRMDAALPAERDADRWLRYLPLMPLLEEGPGYALGILQLINVRPTSVRLVHSWGPNGTSETPDS